jgi:hypothetical protein
MSLCGDSLKSKIGYVILPLNKEEPLSDGVTNEKYVFNKCINKLLNILQTKSEL